MDVVAAVVVAVVVDGSVGCVTVVVVLVVLVDVVGSEAQHPSVALQFAGSKHFCAE